MKKMIHAFTAFTALLAALVTLSACGKKPAPAHTHTFASEWQSDDTRHWQAVSCGHPEAIRYEAHIPDSGRFVGDTLFQTCTVCGREYENAERTELIARGTEAVLGVANAYLAKGGLLEYDQYNSRRQILASPEEATEQSYVYLDCSSYVASVYHHALGVRVIPEAYGTQSTKNFSNFARENYGSDPTVAFYCETLDYETAEAQDACLAELRALIRPGDILVYRRGEKGLGKDYDNASLSGHAMLYMGDGKFTHSSGTSYNDGSSASKLLYKDDPTLGADRATRDEYNYGTVTLADAGSVIARGSGSRMLFGEKSSRFIYNFSILRPMMAKSGTPTVTEQTEKRLAFASISYEKTVDTGLYSTVCVGDSMTYKLALHNTGFTNYKDITLKETLPAGVTLIESSIPMTEENGILSVTFDLARYKRMEITWTVRVTEAARGKVLLSRAEVGGLRMKDIENAVSVHDRETLTAIAEKAREYATSETGFTDPMAFVSRVFSEVGLADPFGGRSASTVLSEIFTRTSETKSVLTENGAFSDTVASRLYGGSRLTAAFGADISLVRTLHAHNLAVADVIICGWGENTRVYMYLGNGMFATVDSETLTCTLAENGSEEWKKEGSYYYQRHLLSSLFAYEEYAVLRP